MGHPVTTSELTRRLAEHHRVMVLGGLAVISHGHPRPTHDADVWLDPILDVDIWSQAVLEIIAADPHLRLFSVFDRRVLGEGQLPGVIGRDGVIRVLGASQPLDVFRDPNELDMASFDEVWSRGVPLDDGTRVMEVIDLLVTKQLTGRDRDLQDIAFLEAKAERDYLVRLPVASEAEALAMLDRFLTPRVAESAFAHPAPTVRDAAVRFLREMTEAGDPFARDILRKIQD